MIKLTKDGDKFTAKNVYSEDVTKNMINHHGGVVLVDGHIYGYSDSKGWVCQELKTGKIVWTTRLKGSGENSGVWSSPVLNGDKICVMNKSAQVFVFKAAPQFELLATNSLDEETNSSLAISDGEVFLRTHVALWCIR